MIKAVCNDKVAVFSENENGEVIKLNKNTATVQGEGKVPFKILKDGKIKEITVDFTEKTVCEIVV